MFVPDMLSVLPGTCLAHSPTQNQACIHWHSVTVTCSAAEVVVLNFFLLVILLLIPVVLVTSCCSRTHLGAKLAGLRSGRHTCIASDTERTCSL